MSEICQSCGKKCDEAEHVEFSVWDKVYRKWTMCPDCADKLQTMVLGYMGELSPEEARSCVSCRHRPFCKTLTRESVEVCTRGGFSKWEPVESAENEEPNGTGFVDEDPEPEVGSIHTCDKCGTVISVVDTSTEPPLHQWRACKGWYYDTD